MKKTKKILPILLVIVLLGGISADAATNSATQYGVGTVTTRLNATNFAFIGSVTVINDQNIRSDGSYNITMSGSNSYLYGSNTYEVTRWANPNDVHVVVDSSFNVTRGVTNYQARSNFYFYDGLLVPNAKVKNAY